MLIKINVNVIHTEDFNFKKIDKEEILILVISTYSEGLSPEENIYLYKFLMLKQAPKMNGIYFIIFRLGDMNFLIKPKRI
ncbi:MAG: hypothetical protein FT671_02615 [Pantoea sp. Brub]|nr:hypothetical protein [Pantoea sp. Brub]